MDSLDSTYDRLQTLVQEAQIMVDMSQTVFPAGAELGRFHETSRQRQIPDGVQSDVHKGANG